MGINRILSGQINSPSQVGRQSPEASPQTTPRVSTPLRPDRFTMGQSWQNRVSASGSNSRWGVQAYAEQQQKTDDVSAGQSVRAEEGDTAPEVASVIGEKGSAGEALLPEDVAKLQELQKIDQQVRAHEQAHMGAAGGLATSGISLAFKRGPDGQNYAVGGEVSIDTSRGATPRETIAKMVKVRAAALAPADPSGQDRKVAASASVLMGDARAELQLDQADKEVAQVVEQAGQKVVENGSGETSEQGSPASLGRYQQAQYQKSGAEEGTVVGR